MYWILINTLQLNFHQSISEVKKNSKIVFEAVREAWSTSEHYAHVIFTAFKFKFKFKCCEYHTGIQMWSMLL